MLPFLLFDSLHTTHRPLKSFVHQIITAGRLFLPEIPFLILAMATGCFSHRVSSVILFCLLYFPPALRAVESAPKENAFVHAHGVIPIHRLGICLFSDTLFLPFSSGTRGDVRGIGSCVPSPRVVLKLISPSS